MAAAAIFGVPSAAHADACSGVTVVVDSRGLGGGIDQSCDAGGAGKVASDIFTESGHGLTYVQRQPGAVCRVDGEPADQECTTMPPSNRYWALYWSTGQSGTWIYSSLGVDSLHVPAGGSVAFSFSVNGATPPGVAPPVTSSASSSAPATTGASATSKPTRRPTRGSTKPRPKVTPTPVPLKPSAKVSASPSASASATGPSTPTAPSSPTSTAVTAYTGSAVPLTQSPSPSPSSAPRPTSASTDNGGGLPAWVPVGLIGMLVLGAGVIVAVRRRT